MKKDYPLLRVGSVAKSLKALAAGDPKTRQDLANACGDHSGDAVRRLKKLGYAQEVIVITEAGRSALADHEIEQAYLAELKAKRRAALFVVQSIAHELPTYPLAASDSDIEEIRLQAAQGRSQTC